MFNIIIGAEHTLLHFIQTLKIYNSGTDYMKQSIDRNSN